MTNIRIFNELNLTIFDSYFKSPRDKTIPDDYNILKLQTIFPNFSNWTSTDSNTYAITFEKDEKLPILQKLLQKRLNQLNSPITIELQLKTLTLKNVNEKNLLELMAQKELFVRIKNPDSIISNIERKQP
jgi:hypothetical protein